MAGKCSRCSVASAVPHQNGHSGNCSRYRAAIAFPHLRGRGGEREPETERTKQITDEAGNALATM